MTDPTEREAIVSIMWEAAGNYSFPRGADRIIAEHIAPLRKALAHAQMEGDIRAEERDAWMQAAQPNKAVDAQFIIWRDRAEAAEATLAKAEAERDDARELGQRSIRRLVELSEPGWIGAFAARDAAESRASALEAKRDEARLAYGEAIETQRIFVARASALEAERDKARADCAQLVADYGERGDLLAECRVRAEALEALLAECEMVLAYAADNLDGILKENDIASIVIRDKCRSLLAKLKARTGEDEATAVEKAYALLWRETSVTSDNISWARTILLDAVGKDGQRRGIEWAHREFGPVEPQP